MQLSSRGSLDRVAPPWVLEGEQRERFDRCGSGGDKGPWGTLFCSWGAKISSMILQWRHHERAAVMSNFQDAANPVVKLRFAHITMIT